MLLASPKRAKKFFTEKMSFTTGPIELNEMMKSNENINIIDVRKPEDFLKGHIPGAVNIPKDKWDNFESLSYDKNNIVYCYSEVCHLAAAAAKHFAENQYPVMELEGGFEQWKQRDLPVEIS